MFDKTVSQSERAMLANGMQQLLDSFKRAANNGKLPEDVRKAYNAQIADATALYMKVRATFVSQ